MTPPRTCAFVTRAPQAKTAKALSLHRRLAIQIPVSTECVLPALIPMHALAMATLPAKIVKQRFLLCYHATQSPVSLASVLMRAIRTGAFVMVILPAKTVRVLLPHPFPVTQTLVVILASV